ncbi:MAG: FHIPEP family type III secretion protein, partial [Candidatus Gastranaerophilaceae bacterium]
QIFKEANYENSIIELFKNMEYTHIYGPNLDRDFYSPFYEEELENALHMINKELSYCAIQEAINKYIEIVALKNLYLIENIIPDFISIGELKYIITNLIKERVSVKDILYVFEKINDLAAEPSKDELLSGIRRALARQITASRVDKNGVINLIELSKKSLNDLCGKQDEDNIVKIESSKIEKIVKSIKEKLAEESLSIKDVTIVLPSNIRQIGFLVFTKFLPEITVVAREEITSEYPEKVIATV